MSKIEIIGVILIIIGTLIFGIYILILITSDYFNFSGTLNLEYASNIGGFIGGVSGSMWALGGILFLYETLKLQRKEFQKTRESIDLNQKEMMFFNLTESLRETINYLSGEVSVDQIKHTYHGRAYIHNIFKEFIKSHNAAVGNAVMNIGLKNAIAKAKESKKSVDINFDDIPINEIQNSIINTYENFYSKYHYNLGHYFRLLYNIIKFIDQNFEESQKPKYVGLLQAQLSNDELGLIFFNCLSKFSKNSAGKYQFHAWIDEFQFLQNIDEQSIIDKAYSDFYPKTKFKFASI